MKVFPLIVCKHMWLIQLVGKIMSTTKAIVKNVVFCKFLISFRITTMSQILIYALQAKIGSYCSEIFRQFLKTATIELM